uniref:Ovule protein n=1 Tax=Heterorhabditis bacteriophora TaxID=37862 RepID=A0A1I7XAS9_HETBA
MDNHSTMVTFMSQEMRNQREMIVKVLTSVYLTSFVTERNQSRRTKLPVTAPGNELFPDGPLSKHAIYKWERKTCYQGNSWS